MRYISLFSGIEAATVAWEPLGWEPVAFSEIDAFPSEVLAHHFPEVPNLGDITKIDWSNYRGAVDIVVGGSPCQSFSVAGKREGLAGESGLMFEYIRAVRELMPKYFVWENVPGALSSEGGAAFGQLLREMDDLGYGLAWRVLDAQFFGVAQRRRRVFLVGCLGDPASAAAVLFERESMRWDYPSSRAKREELAGTAGTGAGGDCIAIAGNIIDRKPENGGHHLGIEDDGACYSLTTADRHAVAYAMRMRAGKSGGCECLTPWDVQSRRVYPADAAWPSLYAGDGGGHGYCLHTIAFDTTQITSPQNGNRPQVDDPCHPLCAGAHAPAVEIGFSGTASQYKDQPIVVHTDDDAKAVYHDGSYWVVRRLMPIECERLQGFPDNWSRIPYRGKPAEECPDTPRYKALGNSMCTNVMEWIGKRIQKVEGKYNDERD